MTLSYDATQSVGLRFLTVDIESGFLVGNESFCKGCSKAGKIVVIDYDTVVIDRLSIIKISTYCLRRYFYDYFSQKP